jgi:DNA helicase-2/ATP-dependent DNA helicase PcrA
VLCNALQRTLFGSTQSFVPSSFLSDIPGELVEASGAERRAAVSTGYQRPATKWAGAINSTAAVRDNKDLELAVGERIKHDSFGSGVVISVTGTPPRQTAEVRFETGMTKRLLVKMAPIEKI